MQSKFSTRKISWKNIVLLIVAISILGISIYSRASDNRNNLANGQNNEPGKITGGNINNTYPFKDTGTSTVSTTTISNYSKDSDGDGLYDWEEILWGTSIQKKDTDGDGVSDGEEIKSNRDPLVKGVGSKKTETTNTNKSAPLNNTDKFGRELFSRYIELKQAGEAGTAEGRDKIVQAMLQSGNLVETPKQDALKSLILLGDSANLTESTIKEYGNAVGKVLTTYSIKSRNENFIIRDYLANTDETAFAELDRIITSYKNIRAGLLKVAVPSDMAQTHLDLINSINELTFIVEAYRRVEIDPIATLQAVGMYQNTYDNFKNALSSIKDYFLNHSITYNSTEYGKIFNQPGI